MKINNSKNVYEILRVVDLKYEKKNQRALLQISRTTFI